MDTKRDNYSNLIDVRRIRPSHVERARKIDELYSDRSRVIFSSSFRRLQQKAQVFSLEPNASVRTRLTHSLEVSDMGISMAVRIAYGLHDLGKLKEEDILSVVAIVENSCLLHDIGNPPFGHFGEAAIRDWAKNEMLESAPSDVDCEDPLLQNLITDFDEFDGNPQGVRVVTRLHNDYDKYSLNLTFSTLLSILKYPRATGEEPGPGYLSKGGYFQTEKKLIEKVYEEAGIELHHRYPFVYIMEAADDIAYCMSDVADGIEKGILTEEMFICEFQAEWSRRYPGVPVPAEFPEAGQLKGFNQDISVPWSKLVMDEVVSQFLEHEEEIYRGEAGHLISTDNDMGKVLDTMRTVSSRILYTSSEAESIELTGYAVITGILSIYSCILEMDYSDFRELVENGSMAEFPYETRLFHLVGKRCVKAYMYEMENMDESEEDFLLKEWWLRVHMIIDHITAMTDEYALQTYQMLTGISLMR